MFLINTCLSLFIDDAKNNETIKVYIASEEEVNEFMEDLIGNEDKLVS